MTWFAKEFTVEVEGRLRLPHELSEHVSWLRDAAGSMPCVGVVSPHGAMLVVPAARAQKALEELRLRIRDEPPTLRDLTGQEVSEARVAASSWELTIRAERSRFELKLPSGARKTGTLPSVGGIAVVFAVGEILEVWTAERWERNIQAQWAESEILGRLLRAPE